jgi:hypothetical protein
MQMTREVVSRCFQTVPAFDYSKLDSGIAKYLRGEAERIRRQYSASIIQIGKALIRGKHYLQHGEFIRWVETEAGIPARTAQAYMRVAEWASDKSPTVENLPPTILYLLSARRAPTEWVDGILERVRTGKEIPSVTAIRQELKALRNAAPRTNKSQDIDEPALESDQDGQNKALLLLKEALQLLADNLGESDFQRFRSILTNSSVLNDPDLARTILAAFSSFDISTQDRASFPEEASPQPVAEESLPIHALRSRSAQPSQSAA